MRDGIHGLGRSREHRKHHQPNKHFGLGQPRGRREQQIKAESKRHGAGIHERMPTAPAMPKTIRPRSYYRVTNRVHQQRNDNGDTCQKARQAQHLVVKKQQKKPKGGGLHALGNLPHGKHNAHPPGECACLLVSHGHSLSLISGAQGFPCRPPLWLSKFREVAMCDDTTPNNCSNQDSAYDTRAQRFEIQTRVFSPSASVGSKRLEAGVYRPLMTRPCAQPIRK